MARRYAGAVCGTEHFVIIDNLDRMSKKNLLFLLTLTGTLFKLPNITYIVAYDKERLNKNFRTQNYFKE